MTLPIPAIVLAAGASTRMGRPKALLPASPAGPSFARRICSTLVEAGAQPVLLVTRAEMDEPLRRALPDVQVVVNPSPERGQLSSLLAGLETLGDPAAVLVTLVDLPLIRVESVRAVVDAWADTQAPLVRPVFEGRHGHPVIFGAALLRALRDADLALGAKPVVRSFHSHSVSVPVDDAGTVEDVDTEEEYRRFMGS